MRDWNVRAYEKYEKERVRPSIDLISRINKEQVGRIIDVGCGSGMSTLQLWERWRNAVIIGLDNSGAMLEQAKKRSIPVWWFKRDCNEKLDYLEPADIIFSNASLQWLRHHGEVIEDWFEQLQPDGVIAVQIPLFNEMPIARCIKEVTEEERWQDHFYNMKETIYHNESANTYYDLFAQYTDEIEMWETDYYHELENAEAILDFCKSTGLRPYLNHLNDSNLEREFIDAVLNKVKKQYKAQENGKTIFKFKRLFIIAQKNK